MERTRASLKNKRDNPGAKPNNRPDITDDEIVAKGLKCLGGYIADAKNNQPEPMANPRRKGPRFIGGGGGNLSINLYFMWSLERVGVIYGLKTIGNTDWYAWGSARLVEMQQPDGAWNGRYHGNQEEISTSFAMLFLCRANVAKDLTAMLKGKVKDPAVSSLKSGGSNLVDKNSKSPVTSDPPKEQPAKVEPNKDPKLDLASTTLPSVADEYEKEAALACQSGG